MTNHASADPAAVLWDMDGTLVDTEPYWIRAETELMNAHGLPWSEEQGLEFVGNELIVSARMMREAGLDLPAEEIVETLMGNVIAQIRESVPFRPGALELLAELKAEGIPSVMVTMSYRPSPRQSSPAARRTASPVSSPAMKSPPANRTPNLICAELRCSISIPPNAWHWRTRSRAWPAPRLPEPLRSESRTSSTSNHVRAASSGTPSTAAVSPTCATSGLSRAPET